MRRAQLTRRATVVVPEATNGARDPRSAGARSGGDAREASTASETPGIPAVEGGLWSGPQRGRPATVPQDGSRPDGPGPRPPGQAALAARVPARAGARHDRGGLVDRDREADPLGARRGRGVD